MDMMAGPSDSTSAEITETGEKLEIHKILSEALNPEAEAIAIDAKRKRSAKTVETKLKIVEFAEIYGNRVAARHFNVARKCVRRYRAEKLKLQEAIEKGDSKRLRVGAELGRKPAQPLLEDQLYQWIETERSANRTVTPKLLLAQAERIFLELKFSGLIAFDQQFKFSNGWLQNFMTRWRLSTWPPTTAIFPASPAEFAFKSRNCEWKPTVVLQHVYR